MVIVAELCSRSIAWHNTSFACLVNIMSSDLVYRMARYLT